MLEIKIDALIQAVSVLTQAVSVLTQELQAFHTLQQQHAGKPVQGLATAAPQVAQAPAAMPGAPFNAAPPQAAAAIQVDPAIVAWVQTATPESFLDWVTKAYQGLAGNQAALDKFTGVVNQYVQAGQSITQLPKETWPTLISHVQTALK